MKATIAIFAMFFGIIASACPQKETHEIALKWVKEKGISLGAKRVGLGAGAASSNNFIYIPFFIIGAEMNGSVDIAGTILIDGMTCEWSSSTWETVESIKLN